MALAYDLSVTGIGNIKRALRSVETEMSRHNAKVSAMAGVGRGGPYRSSAAPAAAARVQASALEKAQAKGHLLRLRQIEKEKAAALRAANSEFRARQRNAERLAISQQRAIRGGAVSGAARPLASAGRTAGMAVGMGGAFIVGSAVAKQLSVEKSAAALANKAFNTPGETRSRSQIQRSLMAQSAAIGQRSGNRAGVVEAIDKFVAISGSLKGAQYQAGFMADLSAATGAEMSDVGRTGGQVLQNIAATRGLDLSNQEDFGQAMEATQKILSAMAGQAKIGSIEFADLATQMGKVMSATSRFEGDVSDLTNQMGTIGQLAIAGGAASPQEAMTAMMRFSDDLVQNAEKFDKMARRAGMKKSFFTDKTKTTLRDPTEIMLDMLEVTRGDLTKGKDIFGIRAMKAFEPFQKAYVSAGGVQDHAQGIAAVRAQVQRFKGAGMTAEEVGASARFARTQRGAKLSIALEDLQTKVGADLVPVIEELIPAFQELAGLLKDVSPYLAAFLKALAKNPLAVGGSLLAGRMALGAGMGMLGAGFRTGLGGAATAGVGGAAGPSVGVGGMPMAGTGVAPVNVVNALAIGAAIGGPIATAITTWGMAEVERREKATGDLLKEATLGDARKAQVRVKAALEKAKTEKTGSLAVRAVAGAMTGQAAQYGPLPDRVRQANERVAQALVRGVSPIGEQREFDIRNLEKAEATAARRIEVEDLDELTNSSLRAGKALDLFQAKLQALQTDAINRGDAPSPVKP